jgi:transposase InsO family protein
MNIHQNAPWSPRGRAAAVQRVLEQGQAATAVAAAFGVSERTMHKWLARFRAEGPRGLQDRSSRPHQLPFATPVAVVGQIARLRRQRWPGPKIAARLGVPRSTVSRILRRLGLGRLRVLDAPLPAQRYERATPGEVLHVDVKKLGRIGRVGHRITGDRRQRVVGIGWEYAYVCVDDASRLAYVEVLPDERQGCARGFLRRAVRWLGRSGIRAHRVMTDNGSAFRSRRFRADCTGLGLRQLFTRPYTPRTNGKAERFIQTLLREWAYVRPYPNSAARRAWLPSWLHFYNAHRPHTSLQGRPPLSRLVWHNNLLSLHT